eukprot:3496604-Rhodomonas_salina.1
MLPPCEFHGPLAPARSLQIQVGVLLKIVSSKPLSAARRDAIHSLDNRRPKSGPRKAVMSPSFSRALREKLSGCRSVAYSRRFSHEAGAWGTRILSAAVQWIALLFIASTYISIATISWKWRTTDS